ncbi:tRNA-binding protein [Alteribacter lacisalsi]|uniref:tRNA-binding protein n=1 Tax=Alteribacter lacisalsi TaxID=2045244 RepID=A0A2W0H138_9BACI|nr:tRNA-binding protein [Alteribacter lacisalsi]PYZ95504.1 tRNA-binding protein [Alteribacter lacisalsi]
MAEITFDQFLDVEIRVGTILEAEPLEGARRPAIKMKIDFGEEGGVKQSSAQITMRYGVEELIGRQIAAVVNFPPMRVAGFKSEVLVMGAVPGDGDVVLLNIDEPVANGTRIG